MKPVSPALRPDVRPAVRVAFSLVVLGVLGTAVAVACAANGVAPPASSSTLLRPADPVVLSGADVPWLLRVAPADLVAWRFDGDWRQIPVQVDERARIDLGKVYHQAPSGVTALLYTDPGTFTGADPDSTLDSNDEIVFMARDAGGRAPADYLEPPGVVPGSGVLITVSDPLDSGVGYVYLFRQDGTLDPGAGQSYVTYTFNLSSGAYLTTYNLAHGPNPEDSVMASATYAHHFSDRWIDDELRIFSDGATGVDILDRHKNLFAPGYCGRSENTFSLGEGAFVVNKSGPVRAIRSYLGANSGPWTQRDHFFYERRQDIVSTVRVHNIPCVMDFFDYSPAASGMTYYDNLNLSGVTVDGKPDAVITGFVEWEMLDGAQGGLVIVLATTTDIPNLDEVSYYLDDMTPTVKQCTGDAYAYGSSGLWIVSALPCTDPARCPNPNSLVLTRTLYYEAPGVTVETAQTRNDGVRRPLVCSAQAWIPPRPATLFLPICTRDGYEAASAYLTRALLGGVTRP